MTIDTSAVIYDIVSSSLFATLIGVSIKIFFVGKKILKEQTANRMSILQLKITNKDMPLEERIKAGKEYLDLGGNGTVKIMYSELLDEYKQRRIKNANKLESTIKK